MRRDWLDLLRCPETGLPYDLDETRASPEEVVEGFLVARGGRAVRPLLQGIPVLPVEFLAHLKAHGHVYARIPLADSRVVRFVLGRIGRGGADRVPLEEVISRYGDLVPPGAWGPPSAMAEDDAGLAAILAAVGPLHGAGLDIGCGVGRGVFVLREHCDRVFGVDRSIARVRRARNVAVTQADFFLPAPPESGIREVPLELDRLAREECDFAVADPHTLPFVDAIFDVVVLRGADGIGPFEDREGALAEAVRVLAPGGVLVIAAGFPGPTGRKPIVEHDRFAAWRGD